MRVPCDASADDDGRRNIELLAGEIDRLDRLDALQLVDGQGMAVDTVAAERRVTWPNITQSATTNCMRAGNSLESRDLGVLEGSCKSDHARHVSAKQGEVVAGQAASERMQTYVKQFPGV